MAKQTKDKNIEKTLWESANKLRGSVEPADYKHVVLGLIFLKFASDKFEEHRQKLIADFYGMANVFFMDEISRWSYIIKKSTQNDIALKIDTTLHNIEKKNKALKGALPDNYFSRLSLERVFEDRLFTYPILLRKTKKLFVATHNIMRLAVYSKIL